MTGIRRGNLDINTHSERIPCDHEDLYESRRVVLEESNLGVGLISDFSRTEKMISYV